MKNIISTLITILLILTPLAVLADTINIPGDQPTIQAGIDAASDGDTILLADGIYTGNGNYNVDSGGTSVTIKSANSPGNCIIDCRQNGLGFLFQSGETITLENLTIKNADGGASSGGGVYEGKSSKLTIINCVLDSNTAMYGGAVYCDSSSSLTIEKSSFTNNSASKHGGAIAHMYTSGNATCSITASTFKHNVSGNYGGAVYTYETEFNRCTFTDNKANTKGGAICFYLNSSSTISNCTFQKNISSEGGAIHSTYQASVTCTNCSFSQNNATTAGGAIWHDITDSQGNHFNLKNCILWGDTSPNEPEIFANNNPAEITYSDIEGAGANPTNHNIDQNPLFLFLESSRQLYLHPESPCIDSGTSENAPPDDIDGFLRPIPDPGNYDMGAYEYRGDIYIWDGGSTSNWTTSSNWKNNTVPAASNIVIIASSTATTDPIIEGEHTIKLILLESKTLTISLGKLIVGGS